MASAWDLIASGDYDQAVREFSSAADLGNTLAIRNRATALLLLGRYDEAFRDTEKAEAIDPAPSKEGHFHSDCDQVRLGVIEWLSTRFGAAGDRWLRIGAALAKGHVSYTDAAGGIGTASILRFAAVRLDRQEIRRVADRLLNKRVKRPPYQSWPLPIGAFYLGQMTAEALLESISKTPILRERQLCQANFAIAVQHLEESNRIGYCQHMATADLSNAFLENEMFLARFEAQSHGNLTSS